MSPERPNPWPWIALSVAIVAVAAVALVLILSDGSDDDGDKGGDDASSDIAAILEPVASANDAVSDELDALEIGDETDAARDAVAAAVRDTRSAARELAELDPEEDALRLAGDAGRALLSEQSYLSALRRALPKQNAARARAANRAARRARADWRIVAREIPGAGGRIAGLDAVTKWAATPVLPDGDAGPGPTAAPEQPSADEGFKTCEGFENVFEVVVEGVSCAEGIQIAQGALNSKSAAGARGYTCNTLPHESDEGTLRYECDGPDGGHVGFTTSR